MRVPARFDVDGDRRLGELAPQRLFEVVAHRVRIVHAHRAGNAQAEVDEGQAPGVAGAQLVDVVGGAAGGGDDRLDAGDLFRRQRRVHQPGDAVVHDLRSEEHTSELQSLMRISYAVFCLKNNITFTGDI